MKIVRRWRILRLLMMASLEKLHNKVQEIVHRAVGNFNRPGWDEYFMSIAQVVASRSNCVKRKVAAIDRKRPTDHINRLQRHTQGHKKLQ